jgi:hypothetical protein
MTTPLLILSELQFVSESFVKNVERRRQAVEAVNLRSVSETSGQFATTNGSYPQKVKRDRSTYEDALIPLLIETGDGRRVSTKLRDDFREIENSKPHA